MMPATSVLLPVHDAEETLSAAIDSVRDQTLADWELVMVLNGCTDRSEAIAMDAAAADPRIRVASLERPAFAAALNHGLQLARSDLVARMDADDRMLPRRLELQVAALREHPEWALCTCGVHYDVLPGVERRRGMRNHVRWLNTLKTADAIRHARFIDAPVAHPAVMFRRAAVLAAGGYRDDGVWEDHELWLRLLERGAVFGRVDETLLAWCDHPNRMTRIDPRATDQARRTLCHRYLLSGPLADGRACRIWGAGKEGRRHAHELLAAGARVDDFIEVDPRKIGQRGAAGLLVVHRDTVGEPDGRLILLCVAAAGAREEIIELLTARGHQPERDYLALR